MEYMNTSFRKKEIMPKIMVYRNVFDADKVLSIIKESEHRADCKLITPWKQWLHLGTMANEISFSDYQPERSKSEHFNDNEDKSTFLFKERDFQVTIRNAYNKVAFDYASQYKDESGWPEWIKTWDLNDSIWATDRINILKYNPTPPNFSVAMHYHTDNHEYENGRGAKWALTVTIYLNDDYEGGDISFLNENTGEILQYKPKAGDITVFPSFAPYYHSVNRVDGNNKYLIRMFWYHKYPGTPEWLAEEEKYGKELWAEMERKRQIDGYENKIYSKYDKYVVLPGEEEDLFQESSPFFAKSKPRRISNDW
jgi:hypothetical protein